MAAFVTKLAPKPSAQFDVVKGCLRICISAPVPDRDDEVVVPATLRTDQYKRNPIVIRCHDQKAYGIAMAEDPAGNFTVSVDPQGLMWAEWYFAPSAEGEEAARLYKTRFLRGASIGFQSDGVEDVPPSEAERLYGVAKRLRRHLGGELLEVSAVPVPSCPMALADRWIDTKAAITTLRGPYRHPSGLVTKSLSVFAGVKSFNPNQPRDDDGKFGEGGGSGGSDKPKPAKPKPKPSAKPKPPKKPNPKQQIRELGNMAQEQFRMSLAARKRGDHEAAKRHMQAGYGYNLAGKRIEDGDHVAADAVRARADQFARGEKSARPFPAPESQSIHTRNGATPMTETATVETTEKAAPVAGEPVTKEPQAMSTEADLEAGSGGDGEDMEMGDPHEMMKQACRMAAHKALDDWYDGSMGDDEYKAAHDMYRADYMKYMGTKAEDEVEDEGTDAEDDPVVESEEKGFKAQVLKALGEIQAKIAEHDEDMDGISETLQLLASKR